MSPCTHNVTGPGQPATAAKRQPPTPAAPTMGRSPSARRSMPIRHSAASASASIGPSARVHARHRGNVRVMVENLTAVAAVIGAVSGVVAAVGVLIVNGKLDRLTGRVDVNTTAITAHMNAAGLHR